jgi:hypothetical protein
MSKVFGIHYIGLRPGVDALEFETFARRAFDALDPLRDVSLSLVRGERGDRVGRYLLLMTYADQDVRDGLFPSEIMLSTRGRHFMALLAPMLEQWLGYASFAGPPTIGTDYVEIARTDAQKPSAVT